MADPWRATGDRIQSLLDAFDQADPRGCGAARGRAEQLVREVIDLYGEALRRIVALSGPAELRRFTDDDLVTSLLLVHGLHPDDLRRRVDGALERVRPYLGSHGGDVELVEVTDDGVLRLRFQGSCKSCPSSAATLELAVEDAVRAAAPEVTHIEVVVPEKPTAAVIPADSLLTEVRARTPTNWHPVDELAGLAPGEVGGFDVDGTSVLACRVGDELFAYRDHCPVCDGSLAGAALHRVPGSRDPVLRCPRCRAHYDVVHAGAAVDAGTGVGVSHLEPLPLLVRDGVLSLAAPREPVQTA